MTTSQSIDVFIAGAGPAGAAAALKLNAMGVSCVIADKATFPRDKICGDALSGKVMINLGRIDPGLLDRFYAMPWKTGVWGIRFIAPNHQVIDIPFSQSYEANADIAPGFVARRMDFDLFLAEELRRAALVDFKEGCKVEGVKSVSDGFELMCGDVHYKTKIYLDACGAQSVFARKFAGLSKRDAHHAGALRVYYKGVTGFHAHQFIELQFLDPIIPGYFWVFPLPDGYANVGIGMRTDYIKKRGVNLNKILDELVANHPDLKDRFRDAVRVDKVLGYGLPLGSRLRPISGDHYMLLGDAGHLIDPLTGEGIGNGIYSGVFAAEQAVICLQKNNFTAAMMADYDIRIRRVIGKEMQLSYRLQQLMSKRWLVNILANIVAGNAHFMEVISRMYTDFELRRRLVTPGFWLRLLILKKWN
jgi:geranylgeranyl reductase family protein